MTTDELVRLIRKYPSWIPMYGNSFNWVKCPLCGAEGSLRPESNSPPKHKPSCPRVKIEEEAVS